MVTFFNRFRWAAFCLVVAALWPLQAMATGGAKPLPALGVEAEATVSGLSSGGYMAAQFAVVYSASVKGVGVVAGGPYDCTQGDVLAAETRCSCIQLLPCSTPTPSVLALQSWNQASGQAAAGLIDPLSHLKAQRVWLFSGGKDKTVPTADVEALRQFYADKKKAALPASQMQFQKLAGAGHGMPVVNDPGGVACGLSQTPWINNCGDDAAHDLLQALYDAPLTRGNADPSHLQEFDQGAYTSGLGFTGLDDTGFVYVPGACAAAGAACRVHVVFHGCLQGRELLGPRYATEAGYNAWAEGSRIVVLYPQVQSSTTPTPSIPYLYNPRGCWDFWGYTQAIPYQSTFATKDAPQMKAVRAMVAALQRGH